ncbi:hypothetical protein AGMMS50256_21920 [Betaproteobacteria bacterium]|nr:hypothetical protein AGMMS50256_21920 [Betaproteobacteria bacterium]
MAGAAVVFGTRVLAVMPLFPTRAEEEAAGLVAATQPLEPAIIPAAMAAMAAKPVLRLAVQAKAGKEGFLLMAAVRAVPESPLAMEVEEVGEV